MSVTAAREWLELLPGATPEERRTLLHSEHAAAFFAGALASAGIPQHLAFEPEAFEVLAGVCVTVHGDVARMLA